jgi:hypothetical protein
MSALSPPVRKKLQKVLQLLASDRQGEVVAAAAAAQRILKQADLSWSDILSDKPAPYREPLIGTTWRTTCVELQKRQGSLRAWERGFVADLPRFQRLSTKQRYCLKEIADRVLGERQ